MGALVESLRPGEAAARRAALVGLRQDAVDSGASLGFLPDDRVLDPP